VKAKLWMAGVHAHSLGAHYQKVLDSLCVRACMRVMPSSLAQVDHVPFELYPYPVFYADQPQQCERFVCARACRTVTHAVPLALRLVKGAHSATCLRDRACLSCLRAVRARSL
jgi:hypothetical protein